MTEVGDKFTKKLDFSHTGIGQPKIIFLSVTSIYFTLSRWSYGSNDEVTEGKRPCSPQAPGQCSTDSDGTLKL